MASCPWSITQLLSFTNSLTAFVGVLVTGVLLVGVEVEGVEVEGVEVEGVEDEGVLEGVVEVGSLSGSEESGSSEDTEDVGSDEESVELSSDESGNCRVGIETSGTGTSATRLPVQAVRAKARAAAKIRQSAFFIMISP